MHHASAQHAHHFQQQRGVMLACIKRGKHHIVQTRGCIAMRIGHQFHQQHAVAKVVRLGYPHTGCGQPVQRVDFRALPGLFLRLPAKLGALGHGARLAGVFDLAVFGVVHRLAKAALGGLLVDLGAAGVIADLHHIHGGLFAAH